MHQNDNARIATRFTRLAGALCFSLAWLGGGLAILISQSGTA